MKHTIYNEELVARVVAELGIPSLERATIGEVVLIARRLEELTGIPFIRMDQGVPGLPPCRVGTEAEKVALDTLAPAIYPAAEGIPELKRAASRFVKAFLDVDVSEAGCVPVTGSVAGSFGSFIACLQRDAAKDTVLFIDPGFPIQKSQLRMLGYRWEQFDIYDHRGEGLRAKMEGYLAGGRIAAIIYSNPNNPAWISLTEQELRVIGELVFHLTRGAAGGPHSGDPALVVVLVAYDVPVLVAGLDQVAATVVGVVLHPSLRIGVPDEGALLVVFVLSLAVRGAARIFHADVIFFP